MHQQHRASRKQSGRFARRTLVASLLAAWLGTAIAAEPVTLDIPSEPLAAALAKFAEQSGIKMTYPAELLTGKTAPPIEGSLTPEQALEQLLSGSGLRYEFVTPDAVKIEAAPAPASEHVTEMAPIEVRGAKAQKSYAVPVTSTASKIDVPNRDIPFSVEARPIALMEDMGGPPRMDEMLKTVAGVVNVGSSWGGGGNSPRWISRGYYSSYIQRDGFSAIANYNAVVGMANVEQIEVLQGPSSVLNGSAASGSGLSSQINIITKQPTAEKSYGGGVAVGSWNYRQVQAYINGAVNDAKTLLVRLDVGNETQDGYQKYMFHTTRTIAPAVTLLVSDQDTIKLRAERTNAKYPGGISYVPYLTPLYNQIPRNSYWGTPNSYRESVTSNALLEYIHKFDNGWKFNGVYSYINNEQIYLNDSITWNQTTNIGTVKMGDGQIHQRDRAVDLRADGHIATGSVDNYVLAGYTTRLTDQYSTGAASTNTVLTETLLGPNNAESAIAPIFPAKTTTPTNPYEVKATYVQDLISFAEKYKLMVGGRYEDIDKGVSNGVPQKWTHFSKRVGLVYQPSDATALYGGYTESFSPTTTTDFSGKQFTPETGYQYEVGVKQTYSDRLNANLALYQLRRDDILTPDPDPAHLNKCGLTGTSACSVQGGTQQVRGIEINVNGQIGTSFRTNFAYSHIFSNATIRSTTASAVGQPITTYMPQNVANLFGIYSFGGALSGLEAGGGIYYRDSVAPTSTFTLPYVMQLDAEVAYRFNKTTKLQLNVKNITNRANDYAYSNAIYFGTPRSYYLNLKVDM